MVKVAGWERYDWLRHGFTARLGGETSVYGAEGELNLGLTREDDPDRVRRNRQQVVGQLGGLGIATIRQVHGARVVMATPGAPEEADGMVTRVAGLVLGVMAADCVPVLLADTELRCVGAVHAGWRGTAAGIAKAGVAALKREFGSKPEHLIAAIGPSIGPCCYAVGQELRGQFADDLFDSGRLNLWEANRQQLSAAGVSDITVVGECTACTLAAGKRKYFSHRADAGVTGRAMGVIASMW